MFTITFHPEKETKGTWRFAEVLETEFSEPKIGILYVRKGTLGEMGYKQGQRLIVTVEVEK